MTTDLSWLAGLALPWNLTPVLATLRADPVPIRDDTLGAGVGLRLRRRREKTSVALFPGPAVVRVQWDDAAASVSEFRYMGAPAFVLDCVLFEVEGSGSTGASLALRRDGSVLVIRTLQPG